MSDDRLFILEYLVRSRDSPICAMGMLARAWFTIKCYGSLRTKVKNLAWKLAHVEKVTSQMLSNAVKKKHSTKMSCQLSRQCFIRNSHFSLIYKRRMRSRRETKSKGRQVLKLILITCEHHYFHSKSVESYCLRTIERKFEFLFVIMNLHTHDWKSFENLKHFA